MTQTIIRMFERCFKSIKVFNPLALCNQVINLSFFSDCTLDSEYSSWSWLFQRKSSKQRGGVSEPINWHFAHRNKVVLYPEVLTGSQMESINLSIDFANSTNIFGWYSANYLEFVTLFFWKVPEIMSIDIGIEHILIFCIVQILLPIIVLLQKRFHQVPNLFLGMVFSLLTSFCGRNSPFWQTSEF